MSEEDWTVTNEYKLTIFARGNCTSKKFNSAITVDNVNVAAREVGISNFKVYGANDSKLKKSEFPYAGNIVVREDNKAAWIILM